MSQLQLRKRLLLAESELNRTQLAGELTAMTADFRTLANRAKSFSSILSTTAVLVAGLAAFWRSKPAAPGEKSSWLQIFLKSAGLISTAWLAYRAQSRSRDGGDPSNPAVKPG
jgi:hypothetical protein